jgi:hypothetical protein
MKGIIALALAAGVAVAATAPADAAGGCGRGFHPGPHGRCFPNGGPGYGPRRGPVVVAPGLVVGNYYGGRGYWDGHRYYQHRERFNNGWRYR